MDCELYYGFVLQMINIVINIIRYLINTQFICLPKSQSILLFKPITYSSTEYIKISFMKVNVCSAITLIYISEYKPRYIILLLTYIWKLAWNFLLDSVIIRLYNISSIFLISMNTDICVLNQTNNVKYLFSRNICYLELLLFNNVFLTSNFIANSIINDVHAYVYTGELVALHITYKFTTVRDYIHISDSTIHFESYNYDDIITKVYIRILNIVTHRHLLIQTMHLLLLYNMLYLSFSHWHDQGHASYDLYLSLTDAIT